MPNQRFRSVDREKNKGATKDGVDGRKRSRKGPQYDEKGQINPYIPHFIAKAPWYVRTEDGGGSGGLQHQRRAPSVQDSSLWYERKKVIMMGDGGVGCENCGSLVHRARECLERPQKLGVQWSALQKERHNDDNNDENKIKRSKKEEWVRQTVELDFEAKRDRWAGYDAADYETIMKEWEERQNDDDKEKDDYGNHENSTSSSDEEGDDDRYGEKADMPGQTVDSKTRTTIRNLRLREDTAKYLLDLNDTLQAYDPKTRSMRPAINKDLTDFKSSMGDTVDSKDSASTNANTNTDITCRKKERLAWEDSELDKKRPFNIKNGKEDELKGNDGDYEDLTRFL